MTPTEQGARNELRSICTMLQEMTANPAFAVEFQHAMAGGHYAALGRLITETYRCRLASRAGGMPEYVDHDLLMGEDADIDEIIPVSAAYVVVNGYAKLLSVASEHNGVFIDWFSTGLLSDEALNDIMDKIIKQMEEAA